MRRQIRKIIPTEQRGQDATQDVECTRGKLQEVCGRLRRRNV